MPTQEVVVGVGLQRAGVADALDKIGMGLLANFDEIEIRDRSPFIECESVRDLFDRLPIIPRSAGVP